MAVITSAHVGAALGVGRQRSTNRSNVGLDKGMLKGFGDRLLHVERQRLTTAGTRSGARRPYLFINPLTDDNAPKLRQNRPQNISRLRRLEKRSLWWTGLVTGIASAFRAVHRVVAFRTYNDQLRAAIR